MSVPGLFVPTYGKSEAAGQDPAATPKASRVLPSKPIAPQPKTKPSSLPSLVFNGNIEYIQTWEAADRAGRALEAARPGVLGFDIEWQVSFVKGQAPAPTATLQLCAPEHPEPAAPTAVKSSPVWGTAFIFHLFHMRRHPSSETPGHLSSKTPSNGSMAMTSADDEELTVAGSRRSAYLPDSLVRVLSDPGILLAGVGVNGDVCRLEKEYEQLRACGVTGIVDLSQMANMKEEQDLRRRGMWSLADLCVQVLDLDLAKPDTLRKGSWEKRPLNVDQLLYAASDAYAGLRLWQVMQAMPDLTIQPPSPANDSRGFESGGVEQRSAGDSSADSGRDAARSALGSGKAALQVRLPLSKMETYRMWYHHGLSVEAVAEARCNKTSTILGYIADCIQAGLPYDWDRIDIGSDTEKKIVRALLTVMDSKAAASEAAAAKAAKAAAATTPEPPNAENVMPEGSCSASASAPHDGAQGSTTCGHCPAGAKAATADGECNAIPVPGPAEASVKRQRMLAGSCAPRGLGCAMTNGLSRQNSSGSSQGEGMSVGGNAGKAGATIGEGVKEAKLSAAVRWESVGLREVKELVPAVEYWQIRMVLARFKSGWCGCARSA